MMNARLLGWSLCATLGLCAAGGSVWATEDGYVSYSGTAKVRRTASFLYHEKHVLLYKEGRISERVVLYTCEDGAPFARKIVTYVDPLAPDFQFEDVSNGMREGVRSMGSERTMYFRGGRAEAEKSAPLPRVTGLVADAGFDEFIRANWQPLMSGKVLPLHFLVPSRLEDLNFQVQHLRRDTLDGAAVEVFRLKLAGVLGWVLSGIDVSYGAADQILMHYDGLSDLRDAAGENFQTVISFAVSDRKPAAADAAVAARQAHLMPCR